MVILLSSVDELGSKPSKFVRIVSGGYNAPEIQTLRLTFTVSDGECTLRMRFNQ